MRKQQLDNRDNRIRSVSATKTRIKNQALINPCLTGILHKRQFELHNSRNSPLRIAPSSQGEICFRLVQVTRSSCSHLTRVIRNGIRTGRGPSLGSAMKIRLQLQVQSDKTKRLNYSPCSYSLHSTSRPKRLSILHVWNAKSQTTPQKKIGSNNLQTRSNNRRLSRH